MLQPISKRVAKLDVVDRLIVFAYIGHEAFPCGELTFHRSQFRHRISVFRYATSWLARKGRYELAPAGFPLQERQYSSGEYELPTPLYDAAPDVWGRAVSSRTCIPLDMPPDLGTMMAAAGTNNTGAIAFGLDPERGPERLFEQESTPLAQIDLLEEIYPATVRFFDRDLTDRDRELLAAHCGDIGGARPKARIVDKGEEYIAKLSMWGDGFDNPKVEALCLSLARACGIPVPEHRLVLAGGRSVLLVKRFDRTKAGERLPYVSALTVVDQDPMKLFSSTTYSGLAAQARRVGIAPCDYQLFRRLLFNCFITNTDDHFRNFGFIRENDKWSLSPAFDLVPNAIGPKRLTTFPSSKISNEANPAVAAKAHIALKCNRSAAQQIYDEVVRGMLSLPRLLTEYEVSTKDVDILKSLMPYAFSPPKLDF